MRCCVTNATGWRYHGGRRYKDIYLSISPDRRLIILTTVVGYIIGHNYHGHYLHAGGLSVNNYVRENKVREVNVRECLDFFGISDFRLVDNCLKMTAYDVICGNESKTVILDT